MIIYPTSSFPQEPIHETITLGKHRTCHYGSDVAEEPDAAETTPEGKPLSWDFAGDPSLTGMNAKEADVYAENSFGYRIIMLFDNEKAAAIIMESDIP